MHLVVLTGAGMSAESGIATFRDANGLWEGYDVMEVASPQGWKQNPELVLDFYNQRRKQLFEVVPNKGHLLLKKLEEYFKVSIITQNVDDLHERAKSTNILHLHGKLKEARSTQAPKYIKELDSWKLNIGDLCPLGSQLRPNIVWFGEAVPNIERAIEITKSADLFLIIGTSLNVYPAANLYQYLKPATPIFIIDPNTIETLLNDSITHIKNVASKGLKEFYQLNNLPYEH